MRLARTATLYLLCGKIAAGKTTFAQRLAARPATLLISEDVWMSSLFGADLKTLEDYRRFSAAASRRHGPHIAAILEQGVSVVLDFPATTVSQRNWMRALIAQTKVAHELYLLNVPDEVCKHRLRARNAAGEHAFQVNEAEYDLFTAYFDPPAPSEGFNVIVHTGAESRTPG